jgi:hypothetical protein
MAVEWCMKIMILLLERKLTEDRIPGNLLYMRMIYYYYYYYLFISHKSAA